MRKLLSMILALAMVLALVPAAMADDAYTLDIYGDSRFKFEGSTKKHTWYVHNTLSIKYGLIIDNLALEDMETGELDLTFPLFLASIGISAEGSGSLRRF